ncbi:MAG: GNAT family protein [Synergistaceae bacterium]|nr:GNAT family protein [Synergistaceae bacterium]
MKIESERFVLRTLRETDLEDFLCCRADENVARYQYWEPYTRGQAIEYISKHRDSKPGVPGEWFQLGIVDKTSGRLIGDCAILLIFDEPGNAEVGCNVSVSYQKNRVADEALKCLFDYAFENLNVRRISAVADVENTACLRLLEGLRMKKDKSSVRSLWFKGKWGRELTYFMLKEDWMALREILH